MNGILPEGYRMRLRFVVRPVAVAGRLRWCEMVRVVQRYVWVDNHMSNDHRYWHDVGYWDEVFPDVAKEQGVEDFR